MDARLAEETLEKNHEPIPKPALDTGPQLLDGKANVKIIM